MLPLVDVCNKIENLFKQKDPVFFSNFLSLKCFLDNHKIALNKEGINNYTDHEKAFKLLKNDLKSFNNELLINNLTSIEAPYFYFNNNKFKNFDIKLNLTTYPENILCLYYYFPFNNTNDFISIRKDISPENYKISSYTNSQHIFDYYSSDNNLLFSPDIKFKKEQEYSLILENINKKEINDILLLNLDNSLKDKNLLKFYTIFKKFYDEINSINLNKSITLKL